METVKHAFIQSDTSNMSSYTKLQGLARLRVDDMQGMLHTSDELIECLLNVLLAFRARLARQISVRNENPEQNQDHKQDKTAAVRSIPSVPQQAPL